MQGNPKTRRSRVWSSLLTKEEIDFLAQPLIERLKAVEAVAELRALRAHRADPEATNVALDNIFSRNARAAATLAKIAAGAEEVRHGGKARKKARDEDRPPDHARETEEQAVQDRAQRLLELLDAARNRLAGTSAPPSDDTPDGSTAD